MEAPKEARPWLLAAAQTATSTNRNTLTEES